MTLPTASQLPVKALIIGTILIPFFVAHVSVIGSYSSIVGIPPIPWLGGVCALQTVSQVSLLMRMTILMMRTSWEADDTWLLIHQALREQTRCDDGKQPSPTAAIIDSQSVKTTELAVTRGFDGHKRVKGRKRHLVTDTTGIPLMVKVTDANVSDNQIAIELLTEVFDWYISIQLVCADAAYRGELEDWLYLAHQCELEIASKLGQQGFEVVPLRWIVERHIFLAWLVSSIDFGL